MVGGALGGVLGFVVTWRIVEAGGGTGPLLWAGAWYGVGVGVGATFLYVFCGGRTAAGAAGSSALGAVLAILGLFAFVVVSELGEDAFTDVLVGALIVFVYWGIPLGLVLLVLPAVGVALALGWVRRLVSGDPD